MVCVVYDVSEEATIEKVRELPIHPRSLPLAPGSVMAHPVRGRLADAALGRLTSGWIRCGCTCQQLSPTGLVPSGRDLPSVGLDFPTPHLPQAKLEFQVEAMG